MEVVAEGVFLAKADGILAGVCIADRVFELVDASLSVVWLKADGDRVEKGTRIGNVSCHIMTMVWSGGCVGSGIGTIDSAGRAHLPQFLAEDVRHRLVDGQDDGRGESGRICDRGAGHAQNGTWATPARQMGGAYRRRHESSYRSL